MGTRSCGPRAIRRRLYKVELLLMCRSLPVKLYFVTIDRVVMVNL